MYLFSKKDKYIRINPNRLRRQEPQAARGSDELFLPVSWLNTPFTKGILGANEFVPIVAILSVFQLRNAWI